MSLIILSSLETTLPDHFNDPSFSAIFKLNDDRFLSSFFNEEEFFPFNRIA